MVYHAGLLLDNNKFVLRNSPPVRLSGHLVSHIFKLFRLALGVYQANYGRQKWPDKPSGGVFFPRKCLLGKIHNFVFRENSKMVYLKKRLSGKIQNKGRYSVSHLKSSRSSLITIFGFPRKIYSWFIRENFY